jgi:putative SOS response-associated peptidase YedK
MCGRYTLLKLADLTATFPWISPPDDGVPRDNIAPTQPILIATNVPVKGEKQQFKFDYAVWGLVPSWAKDPKIGSKMINARAETLAEKPAFRNAFRRRRCLIPADGFYEWRKEPGGGKTKMRATLKSGTPFAFAGLWEDWHAHDGSGTQFRSCTIITTDANPLMAPIHDRMPVILPPPAQHQWLTPGEMKGEDLAALSALLVPYPAQEMEVHAEEKPTEKTATDFPDSLFPL